MKKVVTVLDKILAETKTESISDLKKKLKKMATPGCGCIGSEIKCESFRVFYTSNPNHFAEFAIAMNQVGFQDVLALDYESITKSGKQRGCDSYYMKPAFYNKKINN